MQHPFAGIIVQDDAPATTRGGRRSFLRGLLSLAAGAVACLLGRRAAAQSFTLAIGEDGGGRATTMALGEEGGGISPRLTRALGEEGGFVPRPTTQALGEEGGPSFTEAINEQGGGIEGRNLRDRLRDSLRSARDGGLNRDDLRALRRDEIRSLVRDSTRPGGSPRNR